MTQNPNDWQRPPQDQWGPRQPPPSQWQQQPQYPPAPYPPQYGPPPRRKGNAGKIIAIGCLGLVLIVVLILVVALLLANSHHLVTGA